MNNINFIIHALLTQAALLLERVTTGIVRTTTLVVITATYGRQVIRILGGLSSARITGAWVIAPNIAGMGLDIYRVSIPLPGRLLLFVIDVAKV